MPRTAQQFDCNDCAAAAAAAIDFKLDKSAVGTEIDRDFQIIPKRNG